MALPSFALPRFEAVPLTSKPSMVMSVAKKIRNPYPFPFARVCPEERSIKKRCLRCGSQYLDKDNSPAACSFHGHITGEKGLFSFAPPHQGIDGEWSDGSGVIVYKWNEKNNRPNTGNVNWKKRWSCCSEYGDNAPPCRRGWHVSYDDGYTLY